MITRFALGNEYPIKKLGELVQFLDNMRRPVTEADRNRGPYPYYGANGQQGIIDSYLFDEPLILLAEDGGHFDSPERGIAYRISGKTWVNNHAHVLRPKPEVSIDYLCRVLENYDVKPWVTGSTRGKLTKAGASEIEVPLPPLPEQRRIAAILDKADALRAKRREAIAKLDQLLQSVFLDMFGDPVTNPKGWPKTTIGELASFITSGSRGWAAHYSDSGALFIRIQNLVGGELDLQDCAFVVPPDTAEARRTLIQPGDVLVSITADLGRTAVVPNNIGPAHINQHIAILRLAGVNPAFVSHFLASAGGQQQFQRLNRAAVKAGLNFNDLRSLEVFLPPTALQEKYLSVISKVRATYGQMANFLERSGSQFTSLQQLAFTGTL